MKRSYTIKEFEQVTGVSAHTLRYYDKVGLLSPTRAENGYRIYSLEQVSIAKVITLLQKALFDNNQIKEILSNYSSSSTVNSLKENQKRLRDEIANLRRVERYLAEHIEYLDGLDNIRNRLNKPFFEILPSRKLGAITLSSHRDIVDFFDAGDEILNDPAWPYFCTHGLTVELDSIVAGRYPLQMMYVDSHKIAKQQSVTFSQGRYLSMYCGGSMEDNPNIQQLLDFAAKHDFSFQNTLLVEQVTGPVIEKCKADFLVKLMLVEKVPS